MVRRTQVTWYESLRRTGRCLALLLCAIVLLAASAAGWSAESSTSSINSTNDAEKQVRAQFVYNFANFVEWPKEAFPSADAPIKVCLLGDVHFAPYLRSYSGSLIGERQFNVIQTADLAEIRDGCNILYVGPDERVRLPTFWSEIRYLYVLSIGQRAGFSDQGGIINILRTADHVQFDVNIENALNNGLFLDSDLLALARVIKRNTVGTNAKPAATIP
jgi:YfiR/HmsC-like